MIGELVKYVILTFILLFVAMYGIISFAKYIDDKKFNAYYLPDAVASVFILIMISLMI